ncbi:family 78 glycoside hydrolase catalytic domain [Actinoplanes aureus]|uniref:alpha-L-rhamnosidase n=1 Tax=Actinoplanes aureus TaxID=2792083 RepID=A0A931CBZ6_9ACTN|nr:family 78 glycoside hydrolase catalytic domain [Actinoplanes aureus]MBG0567279.1 family 78 glycoside hydrolase catalytic domain [Actinoplanes aureus]
MLVLRLEHHTDGDVVNTPAPRLSWIVEDAEPGWRQQAYEIAVGDQRHLVESAEQVLVPWPGAPLRSREHTEVRVRVRGDGGWSEWSDPKTVEAGLFAAEDWTARFISPTGQDDNAVQKAFTVTGEITRARLYTTAHGLYRAELNGERVGDLELAPGWTSYPRRLRYQVYDITHQIRPGENSLRVLLGNGWYRGRLGFAQGRALYGDRLALLAQLELTFADGTTQLVVTDETWQDAPSAIKTDDLYDGQRTDLRKNEEQAHPVQVVAADLGRLVGADGPPVRVTGVLPAVKIDGTLVDFGQNLVGWVRLKTRGHAEGHEITVRHAEVLENGELGVRPLRTAAATDTYVLAGPDEVTLEPCFTFHGFRYAEITGAGDLRPEDVEAIVVGSDLRRTGWFDSSHELLNRFHENVVWGMRGNFLDVPTDCPQRDERLGWTGDIQVFAPTAAFLYDTAGFLTSWLADLAVEQHKDGSVPFVVPDVLRDQSPAAAAWGDAATLVPWTVYRRTGDRQVLARQLPSMRAWVDKIAELAGDDLLWTGGFQFGDWLDPAAPPENPFQARTDADVIATAHLARSAQVLSEAAAVLGETAIARRYADLAARVREAFAAEYVTAGGRVLGDAETAYAMALNWALLPDARQRERAGRRLADLVRTSGFRIATGFVGTPLIADALTDAGESAVAYRLLLQTGCPSWLYAVTMGATTVWERWDSMLPDGSINPGEMTSFNHYALGAVADWLHRRVAGLAPAAPGYREILVAPVPGHGLTSASARHLTPYGTAEVSWRRAGGEFHLDLRVPVGSTATVRLPGADPVTVAHGSHSWTVADPVADAPLVTVRDVLDREPLWQSVVVAAVEAGAASGEPAVAARLGRYLDAPAEQLIEALTAAGFAPGAADLRRRLAELLPGTDA